MNPKEVSYSHPQLPLCDTPICLILVVYRNRDAKVQVFWKNTRVGAEKVD